LLQLSATTTLLAVDALFTFVLGVKDLRETEFEFYYLPLSFIVPAAIYILAPNPLLLAFAAVMTVLFVALILSGRAGYMDLALALRAPFVLLTATQNAYSLVGFAAGMIAAYLLYMYRYIVPALCEKRIVVFGRVKVRKEALLMKYIFPPDAHVEDENVEEIKKKLITALVGKCVDAYVGVPLIFVFSVGYAVAVAVSLL